MFWPPAEDIRPEIIKWWDNLSNGVKASAAGAAVLVMGVIAIGGTAHHYQSMHALYAPGTPVMAASATPVPIKAPAAPTAPAIPAPVIMQAVPKYVPPPRLNTPIPGQYQQAAPSPGQAVAETSIPMTSQPSDLTGQAESDWKDAESAVQDASNGMNTASDAGSQCVPVWSALSARVARDKADVEHIKNSLPSEEYARATNAIDRFSGALDSLHQTWNQSRGASQITIG